MNYPAVERDVLGFLVHWPRNADKLSVVESLQPGDFEIPAHQKLYEGIVRCFMEAGKVDGSGVFLAIEHDDKAKSALVALPDADYSPSVERNVGALKNRSQFRRLESLVIGLKEKMQDQPVRDSLKEIERFIFAEYEDARHKVDMPAVVDGLIQTASERGEDETTGYDWLKRVPSLRSVSGGIERGKLYVLGATKKSGKTRFSVAVMKRLIEQGVKPFFASMEMRELEVSKLFLCAFAGQNTNVFNRRITPLEMQEFMEARDKWVGKIAIDFDSFLSVEQLKAKVYRASNVGCSVVFIDYLQRMSFPDSRGKNYATIISDTVARIADMARDYNVAVVLLSQLRNEAEGEGIADMRFLKDSGGIAENADAILVLNNSQRRAKDEKKYEAGPGGEITVDISLEQRSGETRLIKTGAQLGRMDFWELADDSRVAP